MTLEQYFKKNNNILEQFELSEKDREKIELWYELYKNASILEPTSYDNLKYLERARYQVDKKGTYEFFGIISANNLLPWEVVRMLECSHQKIRVIEKITSHHHSSDDKDTMIYSCPDCGITNKFDDLNSLYELEQEKLNTAQLPQISTTFMYHLKKKKNFVKIKMYSKKKI